MNRPDWLTTDGYATDAAEIGGVVYVGYVGCPWPVARVEGGERRLVQTLGPLTVSELHGATQVGMAAPEGAGDNAAVLSLHPEGYALASVMQGGAVRLQIWELSGGAWTLAAVCSQGDQGLLALPGACRLEMVGGELWVLPNRSDVPPLRRAGSLLSVVGSPALPPVVSAYCQMQRDLLAPQGWQGDPRIWQTGRPQVARALGRWWAATTSSLTTDRGEEVWFVPGQTSTGMAVGRAGDVLALWEEGEDGEPSARLSVVRNWEIHTVVPRFVPYSARSSDGRCWMLGSALDMVPEPETAEYVAARETALYVVGAQSTDAVLREVWVEFSDGTGGGPDDPAGDAVLREVWVEFSKQTDAVLREVWVEFSDGTGGGPDDPGGDAVLREVWVEFSDGTGGWGRGEAVLREVWLEVQREPGSDLASEAVLRTVWIEVATANDAPGEGEAAWFVEVNEDEDRPCIGVCLKPQKDDQDFSHIRALVRTDAEDQAVDNWASYEPLEIGATHLFDEPATTVRVGAIQTVGTDLCPMQITYLREAL